MYNKNNLYICRILKQFKMKKSQQAILELINLCGLSQIEMAKNSGFRREQITLWKNGTYVISLENFIHLCQSNGVNPDVPLSRIATNEALENCERECLKSKSK